MYVAIPLADGIYRKDITDDTSEIELVVDDSTEPNIDHPLNIEIEGDLLYFTSRNSDKIFRVDISNPPFIAEEILSFNSPVDLLIDDGYLYYSNYAFIYRIELSSLGVDEFTLKQSKLYPNPIKDILNISQIRSTQPYEIYDSIGRKVKEGVFEPNNTSVNIENLNSGIYYLKFLNTDFSQKFIKK